MDIAARFGQNIARCRRRTGQSQEELSIRASLHRTEVSQLERGLRLARIDTLVKVAGALEVTPNELLVGIEWSPGSATVGAFSVAAPDAGASQG